MADEIVDSPVVPEATPDAPAAQIIEQQASEISPIEEKARKLGWKPKGKFDKDEGAWMPAEDFLRWKPLYDRTKQAEKKSREHEQALHDMVSHIDKVAEASYKRAIADLQREKREAVSVADIDRVEEIDKEINQIKTEMVPPKPKDTVSPVIVEWVSSPENKWFSENPEMKAFAISFQESLYVSNPNMGIEETLKLVSKAVKKAYPDKFNNPARQSSSIVETAVSAPKGKKPYSFSDLTDEQRNVAWRFERMGIMTKDDYVKQLVENNLIGA